MTITVGTITIPITRICTGIQAVHIAGVSVWDLDTRDGECPSLLDIPLTDMVVIMADTTPTMAMAILIMAIPIMAIPIMADTMEDATPIMEVMTIIMGTLTAMEGWIAGIHMDIQVPAM